jgi:hypothetical protein
MARRMCIKVLAIALTNLISFAVMAKPAIIIAGDSWAMFPCWFKSFQKAFATEHLDVEVKNCFDTTATNIKAANWLSKKPHQKLLQKLRKYTEVKVVYLSLGGNDLLSAWHTDMSADDEERMMNTVLTDVKNVITAIHEVRPDVKILLSGYDFGRFTSEHQKISVYNQLYEHLGRPTPAELHWGVLRFLPFATSLVNHTDIFYIHHHGLMQYHFGNVDVGLASHQTASPELISPPDNPAAWGGVPEYENGHTAMLRVSGLRDSYHLSPTGYYYVAKHSMIHYFKKWFSR